MCTLNGDIKEDEVVEEEEEEEEEFPFGHFIHGHTLTIASMRF
jgi:hypothetical protein